MKIVRHFLAGTCLVISALSVNSIARASGHTGSGTVSFEFLDFYGPYGVAPAGTGNARSGWTAGSYFNGQHDTVTADFSPYFGAPYFDHAGTRPTGASSNSEYQIGGRGFNQSLTTGAPIAGPSSMTFGYDYWSPSDPTFSAISNVLSFSSAGFVNIAQGQQFTLGTLTFKNGGWFGAGTSADYNMPSIFGFRMTTQSANGPAFNQISYGAIRLTVNAPGGNDVTTLAGQEAEADWITIYSFGADLASYASGFGALQASPNTTAPGIGSFRVFDDFAMPAGYTTTGTVDIVGMFNSLDLLGLTNPVSGFTTAQSGPLPVNPPPPPPVPEPSSWALLITGFALAGTYLRRARRVGLPSRTVLQPS